MKRKFRLKLYRIQLITNNKYFIIQHSSESERRREKGQKLFTLLWTVNRDKTSRGDFTTTQFRTQTSG
uniref:Putative ovule protein n=1 Tax=Solanum chacoense TaxID=4108 RepID=A0A0V0IT40_SOLCH